MIVFREYYHVANVVSSNIQSAYKRVFDQAGFLDWVSSVEGELLFHGSFKFKGWCSLVMGSDCDAVLLTSHSRVGILALLKSFCAEHMWDLKINKNIATVQFFGNLKLELLVVKNKSSRNMVPNLFWRITTNRREIECDVHEAVSLECPSMCIKYNATFESMVQEMFDLIVNSEVTWSVYTLMKTCMHTRFALGEDIKIPSVVLMCAAIAGHQMAIDEVGDVPEHKLMFCVTMAGAMNCLDALSVIYWSDHGHDYTLLDVFRRNHMLAPLRQARFEIINDFQAACLEENIPKLGKLMEQMGVCTYHPHAFPMYEAADTFRFSRDLTMITCILNSAVDTLDTIDYMPIFSDAYSNGGASTFIHPTMSDAFRRVVDISDDKEKERVLDEELKRIDHN